MDDITKFLTAGANTPFLLSMCVVVALFIIQCMAMMVGHGGVDHDVDYSLDANGNGIPDYLEHGGMDLLGWMNPGHVPGTIFMLLFSGSFAILGYSGQWIFDAMTGHLAPPLMSGPLALAVALPVVRSLTLAASNILPRDETSAVSLDSLAGSVGVVTAGPIHDTVMGMARFADQWATDHSLMVSSASGELITTGESVVLVGPHPTCGAAFLVRRR